MTRWLVITLSIIVLSGCAAKSSRSGVISQQLPLTIKDLAEIKKGEKHNKEVLGEYQSYQSPKLSAYANTIALSLSEVSSRPHLPYKVVLLDSDEVNAFGGPGGYIYMTRGMLNFIESEAELAGILAHEIVHIANYEYADKEGGKTKMQYMYDGLLKGTELGRDAIGSYGTAAYYGVKYGGMGVQRLIKRFDKDTVLDADAVMVKQLMEVGYDPRGYGNFMDRLATIPMEDVNRFVLFLNTRPPFEDRRAKYGDMMRGLDLHSGKVEFKKDVLSEVRQVTINSQDSIIFEPASGVHHVVPLDVREIDREKQNKPSSQSARRWGWF